MLTRIPGRKVLRGQHSDVFRVRESSLELHLSWLDAEWAAGERNGAELWRRLRNRGFGGCLRVVSEWAARRRRAEEVDGASLSRAPSVRTIARFLTVGRDRLSKSESVTVAAIEAGVPLLVEARDIVATFQAMIRKKSLGDLERKPPAGAVFAVLMLAGKSMPYGMLQGHFGL